MLLTLHVQWVSKRLTGGINLSNISDPLIKPVNYGLVAVVYRSGIFGEEGPNIADVVLSSEVEL